MPERLLLLGVNERELAPVGLDVDQEPHLLVFGDGRSGKSALLRSYAHEIMRTRTPRQAQIVVVDFRRSLLGEVPDAPVALRELRRVLRPAGRLVVGEILVDPDFVSLPALRSMAADADLALERRFGPRFAYGAVLRPIVASAGVATRER